MIPVVVGSSPIGHPSFSRAKRAPRAGTRVARAAPRKWRAPRLAELGSPEKAFGAIFSAALAHAGANVRGVLEADDPEYLHQLRVGLRRLRSALRAFAPFVEKPKPLLRTLRRIVPVLGAARDWDVFVGWLEEQGAQPRLLAAARRRRAAARRAARRAIASPQFQGFVLRALRWVHSVPWSDSRVALTRLGAQSLERLHRKAIKHGLHGGEKHRHALRIKVKRLRYACEFFAPCFAPASVRPYLERLEALQEILGELNDVATARRLLSEIGSGVGPDRPGRLLAARERRLIVSLAPAWAAFARLAPPE